VCGRSLCPVVLTSSSPLPLSALFEELATISNVYDYEVFLLTGRHLWDFLRHESMAPQACQSTLTNANLREILSDPEMTRKISEWLEKLRDQHKVRYRALATYLPDISSFEPNHFREAKEALVQVGRIAKRLGIRVVEMVAGTLLEKCSCKACREIVRSDHTTSDPVVHQGKVQAKVDRLLDGMRHVLQNTSGVAYALEMEPGPVYVLNEAPGRIRQIAERILDDGELRGRLGFNIDIGHMRIGGVGADSLKEELMGERNWRQLIFHSHISDAPPGTHTRDQPLGSWTAVSSANPSPYDQYLEMLLEARRSNEVFSGAISIELEGCHDLSWVEDSCLRLRYLIERLERATPKTRP